MEFQRLTTRDESDFLDRFLGTLRRLEVPFCLIGGQAVNAYAEPVVSLDLDVVVVTERLRELEAALRTEFQIERFEHSLNVSDRGSDLRVQIQTDPRYQPFIIRAHSAKSWAGNCLSPRWPICCKEKSGLIKIPLGGEARDKRIWPTSRACWSNIPS
jgi:hypothetical protein